MVESGRGLKNHLFFVCKMISFGPVLFLLTGPKWVFRPAGATRCPDKGEIWHDVPNFTFIGAKMWEYSPQNVKMSNFGHKFAPQGRLICTILTKFSAFVRV